MDGVSIAKMQEAMGVREIVEDVDLLRMMLGFDNVVVLTPKVEVRLRSAEKAQIPLKMTCKLPDKSVQIVLTFPSGYPEEALLAEVSSSSGTIMEEMSMKIQRYAMRSSDEGICDLCNTSDQTEILHRRAPDVLNHLRRILAESNCEIFSLPSNELDPVTSIMADSSENPDNLDAEFSVTSPQKLIEEENEKYYSCMVCGQYLFSGTDVEKHAPTQRDSERRGGSILPCSSIFTSSPPNFVSELQLTENTSKIACPKCRGKLGLICWIGSQCSCGAWVTPAFQFTNSKVDAKMRHFDVFAVSNQKVFVPTS